MKRVLIGIAAAMSLVLGYPSVTGAATGWTIQPTPNPTNPFNFNALGSVACVSSSDCVAVGTNGASPAAGLSELWNGSTWRLHPTASPPGLGRPQLGQVSCPAAADCVATTDHTGSEHWNGSAWTFSHYAKPAPTFTSFEIGTVSCAAVTNCIGYGGYTVNRTCFGVAERWNGSTWAVQSSVPGGCFRTNCRFVSAAEDLVSHGEQLHGGGGQRFRVLERQHLDQGIARQSRRRLLARRGGGVV